MKFLIYFLILISLIYFVFSSIGLIEFFVAIISFFSILFLFVIVILGFLFSIYYIVKFIIKKIKG